MTNKKFNAVHEVMFSDKYPVLKKNATNILKANDTYNKLSQYELDAYYNTLLNPPDLLTKEKHRHPAATAILTQQYGPDFTRELGRLKEDKDMYEGQSIMNSLFDLQNNEKGIKLGQDFPNINRESIYDYLMNDIRGDVKKMTLEDYNRRIYEKIIKDAYTNVLDKYKE